MKTKAMKRVPMADWGKDHYSLLAYVETLCVEGRAGVGTLDWARCRVNEKNYPLLKRTSSPWKPEYGTRLSGFFGNGAGDRTDPKRRLGQHDDVNCLDDLADEGLVEILSLMNGFVKITNKGREIAGRLRAHKSKGGYFADFNPAATVTT